ncbi:MAG: FAD-dependent oxidoreductase, partial [Burkholderiaceae bacterium]
MQIAIIGAGVIGTAAAWEFLRQGKRVILLEALEAAGLGTSYANAGQLSYDYVAPLADPGVFRDLPKWMLNPASPLRFRPQPDPRQWCWLAAFLKACNTSAAQASTKALLQLSYLSRDTLHAWLQETPIEFHHRRNGKLIAYRSSQLLEKARKQVAYQASHGSSQRMLDRQEAIAIEPALAHLGS